ncbi:hypothetical protein Aduo_008149 [Ancylostoma duodenale]
MLSLAKTFRDGGLWEDEDVALVRDWLNDLNSIGSCSDGVTQLVRQNFVTLCLPSQSLMHIATGLHSPRSLIRF